MPALNLYKIDNKKITDCIKKLSSNDKNKRIYFPVNDNIIFELTLYLFKQKEMKDLISWNWLLSQFQIEEILNTKKPKSVLLIKKKVKSVLTDVYAITFGNSYFLIDQFCDRDFGFNFASRINFSGVKTSTFKSPNLKRNKTVSTYVDYEELTFDSGDSIAKLKIKAKLDKNFDLFKPELEIGSSIRFTTIHKTLENIISIISYVENKLSIPENQILHKIPLFKIVNNKDLLKTLNKELDQLIYDSFIKCSEIPQIVLPELEIVGANEIFKRNDYEYQIKYIQKSDIIQNLNVSEISLFCEKNNITDTDNFKKLKIIKLEDSESKHTENIINIIEFTNDNEHCIFSKGKWYKYNEYYEEYLENSINQINTIYNKEYDFNKAKYDKFIDEKYIASNKTESKDSIKKSKYREFAFNTMISENFNFDLYDRIDTSEYEKMDLYERDDKIMFAVKFGKASSSLCYAIDQSLTSLGKYISKKEDYPEIKKVGLWFILERKTQLSLKDETHVNLFDLKMLMLHNRLDQWRKEVLLKGLEPIVYINYNNNDDF